MTNHVGPVCLTAILLDVINPKGKVINVSSKGHMRVSEETLGYLYKDSDFSNIKNDYNTLDIYCLSKIGNIYHAKELNEYIVRIHKEIKTASLHPGVVNTDFFSSKRFSRSFYKFIICLFYPILWLLTKDLFVGAQTTLHIAYMDYDDLNSGAYFNNCKQEKLDKLPSDKEKCEEFMNFTERLILNNWNDIPEEIKLKIKF